MTELNEVLREHDLWLNGEGGKRANLRGADLQRADLRGANLQRADLKWADLDYSCLPLWCGSLLAHYDDRQLVQLAYHLVCAGLHSHNASPEVKLELTKIIDLANRFHRVDECGRLAQKGDDDK